jgi:hypothetical protein
MDALTNPLAELHIANGVLALTPRAKSAALRAAHVEICRSKIRFTRKALARAHAKRVAHKGRQPNLKPYECQVCNGWHVTKKK